jgi:stress-induced morphogen
MHVCRFRPALSCRSSADESHLHAGHRFVKESGITQETHFKVFVVSQAFEGKVRGSLVLAP